MSLSWNSLRRLLGAQLPVGLDLGRDTVTAAVLARRPDGWEVREAATARVGDVLFVGEATPAREQALTEAVARVREALRAAPHVTQVAVPDAAVSLRVFELERLPASRRLRAELVRWRFAQEFARDAADFACAHQVYGKQNGRHLVLGLAMAADWAELVRRACRAAGFLVTAVDMRGCHRHNRLRPVLASDGNGGALVALDPDAWSLSAWDEAGRLRLVRGRMRDVGDDATGDGDVAIATEIERSLRAYAQSTGERSLYRLSVLGAPEEATRLAEQLNGRLRERCAVLPAHTGLGDAAAQTLPETLPQPWGLTAPALATAIPR